MSDYNSSILLEQYKIYADLYKHEDDLTWTKLHKMIVLTAALLTVFGLALNIDHTLAILVAGFGIFVSLLFFFTIRNGAIFLTVRRQNFIETESNLIVHGGFELVLKDEENIEKIMNERGGLFKVAGKIKTSSIIPVFPILLLIAWIGLIAFITFNDTSRENKIFSINLQPKIIVEDVSGDDKSVSVEKANKVLKRDIQDN